MSKKMRFSETPGTKVLLVSLAVFVLFFATAAYSEERKAEPYQLFYTANHNYELRDYVKAIEGYAAVLDMGLESGNLYYNMGNSFLKMGKLGFAILYYEKAKKLIPYDSDLRANLSYARSLVEGANDEAPRNFFVKAVDVVFGLYSLRAIVFSTTALYIVLILLVGASIMKPFFAKRFRVVPVLIGILFIFNLSACLVRYFDERILEHGVVMQKDVECKYEPIEKSTTYYTLHEGGGVLVLSTRSGWRQVKRPDGKVGWVKKEAVEKI